MQRNTASLVPRYGGRSLPLICSWPLAPGQNKQGRTETFRCCKRLSFATWRRAFDAQRARSRTPFDLHHRFAIGPLRSVGSVRNASKLPVANSASKRLPHKTAQKLIILKSE